MKSYRREKGMVLFYGSHMSNWYRSDFTLDGVTYSSSEQYMMAQKATLFKDDEALAKIMATKDPKAQKALGKKVKGFVKEEWEAVARPLVYKGCLAKYEQNATIAADLLSTDNDELVEASPTDRIWGIGLAVDNDDALDKTKWRGTNWLGQVLMRVRDTLRKAAA
jgi:ribA/ribD-fused uncharacterized protein